MYLFGVYNVATTYMDLYLKNVEIFRGDDLL